MGRVNLIDLYGVRPLYQPQFGHTMWGNFDVAHWGQTLRAGRSRRPVGRTAATRLGFAGLALGDGHRSSLSTGTGGPVTLLWIHRRQSPMNRSPSSVAQRGSDWCLALAGRLIAVDTAVGTQSRAVLSTQRRERQVQEDRVVHQGRQINEIILDDVGLFVTGPRSFNESLVDGDVAHAQDRRRAAPTDPVPRRLDGPGAQSPTETLERRRTRRSPR
jgi:hypothetical protein